MKDSYANYFCKKFFDCLCQKDRIEFLSIIQNDLKTLAIDITATYPIQGIIEQLGSKAEKNIIYLGIKDSIPIFCYNIYGTHVLEKILSYFEDEFTKEIIDYVSNNFIDLAYHINGICIVKKLLLMTHKKELHQKLKKKVYDNALDLIVHQYGNYVIQVIFENWDDNELESILNQYKNKYIFLSKQKYSSNAIERIIEKNRDNLEYYINEICSENNLSELNKEFTEYFEIKESIPFKLHIVNNVPKKDKFSCEYCNRSCKYCSFNFKFSDSLLTVKKSQKIKRPFLIYLEVLNYSEKPLCDKIMSHKDFSKDLLIKSKEINIYDCFEAFRTEEKLEKDNSWYCSNCKKNQEAFKKLEIYRAPNILIVQLKRFDCKTENIYEGMLKNKKNDSLVVFPLENLDISKYVVEENSRKDSMYDLCAISQHYGSLSSGHYTAFCKNENEWYNFDDEKISKISNTNHVVSKGAYILIFRKKSLCKTKTGT